MDDFVISTLQESRNEWCSRLVSIFTPLIIEGVQSIYKESWKLCVENDETNKYLMTFQNMLLRIPKWNNVIVENERTRMVERSKCDYLEDLISCVHIIQLKVLTSIRVGNKQKKIDISIPKLDTFIHKVYIHCARKIYKNVYLFEKNISPLQVQKNNREIELIIQECVLMAVRESIPTESIIRAYMEESVEHEEEVFIEDIEEEPPVIPETAEKPVVVVETPNETIPEVVPSIQNIDDKPVINKLSFNNIDATIDEENNEKMVDAPKTIERLEEISTTRALQRKLDEINNYDDDDNEKIHISNDEIILTDYDTLDNSKSYNSNDFIELNDVEELF